MTIPATTTNQAITSTAALLCCPSCTPAERGPVCAYHRRGCSQSAAFFSLQGLVAGFARGLTGRAPVDQPSLLHPREGGFLRQHTCSSGSHGLFGTCDFSKVGDATSDMPAVPHTICCSRESQSQSPEPIIPHRPQQWAEGGAPRPQQTRTSHSESVSHSQPHICHPSQAAPPLPAAAAAVLARCTIDLPWL